MNELKDKVAVVTRASRGIGAAVARALDEQGAKLGLAARRGAARRRPWPGAEDVAAVVLFVLTRPRNHRILETALRPMSEASWGYSSNHAVVVVGGPGPPSWVPA